MIYINKFNDIERALQNRLLCMYKERLTKLLETEKKNWVMKSKSETIYG